MKKTVFFFFLMQKLMKEIIFLKIMMAISAFKCGE